MTSYKPGDVVVVPFPFVDRPIRKVRPALVLSNNPDGDRDRYLILAMITSAKRSSWKSDILLSDWKFAGLNAASMLRWKLFTIEAALVIEKRGSLSGRDREAVKSNLNSIFSLMA